MGKLIDVDKLELEPDAQGGMNGVLFCGRSGGKTVKLVQEALKAMIDNAPAVDAVLMVDGLWEWYTEDVYRCTNCGEKSNVKEVMGLPAYRYCPNCGARMQNAEV